MNIENKNILITGASGALGKQLVYELHRRGINPICQVRKTSDTRYIDSLNLEKRVADLRFQEEIDQVLVGVDLIIHTAAFVDFRQDRLTQFTGINTIAALDLFKAAQKAGVEKFLHISTVAAVGASPFQKKGNDIFMERDYPSIDENWVFNLDHLHIPYIMTKRSAENELLSAFKENSSTELIIVNASIIIAPSRSGDNRKAAIRKFFKSSILPDLKNIINLVDIRDLVPGILLALEKGKPGERYILGGDNITGRELLLTVSAILGKVPHLMNFPRGVLNTSAFVNSVWSKMSGKSKISFYPDLVKLLDYDWSYSSSKALTELGYKSRSIQITLTELLSSGFNGTWLKN